KFPFATVSGVRIVSFGFQPVIWSSLWKCNQLFGLWAAAGTETAIASHRALPRTLFQTLENDFDMGFLPYQPTLDFPDSQLDRLILNTCWVERAASVGIV